MVIGLILLIIGGALFYWTVSTNRAATIVGPGYRRLPGENPATPPGSSDPRVTPDVPMVPHDLTWGFGPWLYRRQPDGSFATVPHDDPIWDAIDDATGQPYWFSRGAVDPATNYPPGVPIP